MDPDKLLLKISLGKSLTTSELEEVINFLNGVDVEAFCKSTFIDDVYSFILVLSKTDLKQYHYVLEKFLHVNDPLTISLVIETLTVKWNLFDEYMERILDFSLGVNWDLDNDLRNSAIKALCVYLNLNNDKNNSMNNSFRSKAKNMEKVLDLLVSFYDDATLDIVIRNEIYETFSNSGILERIAISLKHNSREISQ